MKEVKKVSAALRAVERWEEYLFRRAFGVILIAWAVVVAVAGFITLKAAPIASVLGMDRGILIAFTWLVCGVAAAAITIYSFASAARTIGREKSAADRRRDRVVGIAIGSVWSVLIPIAGYFGGYLGYAAAWPLFIGIANVLTYAIGTTRGTEQLVVGLVLLAASPVIHAMGISDVAYVSMLAVIVLAYGAGGMYALLTAPRALIEEKRLGGAEAPPFYLR